MDIIRSMLEWKGSGQLRRLDQFVANGSFDIHVELDCQSGTYPWLHHFGLPGVRMTKSHLTITSRYGGYSPPRIASPHWKLPRSLPPSYTPFTEVTFHGYRSSTMEALALLLRHFKFTRRFVFDDVVWPNDETEDVSTAVSLVSSKRPVRRGSCYVESRRCTQGGVLCFLVSAAHSGHPFHGLPSSQATIVVSFLRQVNKQSLISRSNLPIWKMEWGKS